MKTLYTKNQLLDLFKDTERGWLLESFTMNDADLFRFEKEFEIWVNKNFDFVGGVVWRVRQL